MTVAEFRSLAFAYCKILGASETSGTRTAKRNAEVGGVEHSAHVAGLAVDVVYDAPVPEEKRRAWASRLGLLLIVEDDHDHLQPAGWKAG